MANAVEQSSLYSSSFVDARISFSNDFADSSQETIPRAHDQVKYKEAPVSSDFKFNVENFGFTTSAADEIFFGGVLLPLEKATQRKVTTTTTLREELSAQDSDRTNSKASRSWWKLGLNKSKKIHSNNINFHLPNRSQNCLASILESDD
ncbi:hypothetical protein CARUB_v10014845mg [Capsella rubella]|uniref:Uncharacterized protein n=1 Tax=Capsella rubella TaxID=81985 RepID=R0I5K6_9BRAS|nr:uncharacterized protein LOC17892755 [Capsella rubella]EOA31643.1 hypothetical protein CARUB_v10014845mg [Capsella rubella]